MSSQPSPPRTRPSPQIVAQTDGSSVQVKPRSIVQSEQPSPTVSLPSSHASGASSTPSPQPGGGPPSSPASTAPSTPMSAGGTSLPRSIEKLLQPFGSPENDWLAIAI